MSRALGLWHDYPQEFRHLALNATRGSSARGRAQARTSSTSTTTSATSEHHTIQSSAIGAASPLQPFTRARSTVTRGAVGSTGSHVVWDAAAKLAPGAGGPAGLGRQPTRRVDRTGARLPRGPQFRAGRSQATTGIAMRASSQNDVTARSLLRREWCSEGGTAVSGGLLASVGCCGRTGPGS